MFYTRFGCLFCLCFASLDFSCLSCRLLLTTTIFFGKLAHHLLRQLHQPPAGLRASVARLAVLLNEVEAMVEALAQPRLNGNAREEVNVGVAGQLLTTARGEDVGALLCVCLL